MLQAQISIPNGGFENWTTTTYSYPTNYRFNFTFSPALAETPDSVVIAFASSGFSGAIVGSTLVLEFYYKYEPVGDTYANVNVYLKNKDGISGWYGGATLEASSEYKYMEIQINVPFVPDSVVIHIHSAIDNNLTQSNVGSTLIIDEMCFQSQKTGLNNIPENQLSIYPNPTDKGFYLPKELVADKISITNISGAKIMDIANADKYVDVSNLPEGIYIVQLQTNGTTTYRSKLIINR